MRTVGIDLAAQPKKTAACTIDWTGSPAKVVAHPEFLDDDALIVLATAPGVAKVAIDAPFGWPVAFVEAIASHASAGAWPPQWRQGERCVFRATDHMVRRETGQRPLSVSASLLAVCAMRCAGLLARLQGPPPVDRSGTGLTVEAYPAAALRRWGLNPASWKTDAGSYKGNGPGRRERRERLVQELADALQGVVLIENADVARMVDSDDHLDAFVCALIARAGALHQTDPPPADLTPLARVEGWIALPTRPLAALR
jgi:hypothetical protein